MLKPIIQIPIDPAETVGMTSDAAPLALKAGTTLYAVGGASTPTDRGYAIVLRSNMVLSPRARESISYNEDQRRKLFDFVRRFADSNFPDEQHRAEARALMAEYGEGLPL